MFSYVPGLGSYVCPGHKSRTKGSHPAPRLRSYSMSAYLNHDYVGKSPPIVWSLEIYPDSGATKLTSLAAPTDMFTITEDHPGSIDDGAFETMWSASQQVWMELPADGHGQGANFSMADGRVELKHWKWPKKFSQYSQPVANNSAGADLSDLRWIQQRIPSTQIGRYPEP